MTAKLSYFLDFYKYYCHTFEKTGNSAQSQFLEIFIPTKE